VALVAGAGLAAQASLNSALASPLQSSYAAISCSFLCGVFSLCLVVPFSLGQKRREKSERSIHFLLWIIPGLIGAFYVSMATTIGPTLGFSMFFICVVCGQLSAGVVVDQWGLLDIPQKGVTVAKISAVAFVLAGAGLSASDEMEVSSESHGLTVLYMFLALLSGIGTAVQVVITSTLASRRGIWPHRIALLAFSTGCVVVLIIWGVTLIVDTDGRNLDFNASEPWMFGGGSLGAFYVAASISLAPKLGVALFLVCVVAGQLAMALAIDSEGLFQQSQKDIGTERIIGLVCVFMGVVVYRFLPSPSQPLVQTKSPKGISSNEVSP